MPTPALRFRDRLGPCGALWPVSKKSSPRRRISQSPTAGSHPDTVRPAGTRPGPATALETPASVLWALLPEGTAGAAEPTRRVNRAGQGCLQGAPEVGSGPDPAHTPQSLRPGRPQGARHRGTPATRLPDSRKTRQALPGGATAEMREVRATTLRLRGPRGEVASERRCEDEEEGHWKGRKCIYKDPERRRPLGTERS